MTGVFLRTAEECGHNKRLNSDAFDPQLYRLSSSRGEDANGKWQDFTCTCLTEQGTATKSSRRNAGHWLDRGRSTTRISNSGARTPAGHQNRCLRPSRRLSLPPLAPWSAIAPDRVATCSHAAPATIREIPTRDRPQVFRRADLEVYLRPAA